MRPNNPYLYNENMLSGEELAWSRLAKIDPEDVCLRAKATFDESSGIYILKSFQQDVFVSSRDRRIFGNSVISDFMLNKLDCYSRLPILWYLINAKDVPLSGELRKPADMTGGQIYLQGTHILPLDKVAQRYSTDIAEILRRGNQLGGEATDYADASIKLFPFPRVPVVILVWIGDEEFSPRCNLLFDSTCELHLPQDIIWSTAMMSLLLMLEDTGGETYVRPKS